MDISRYIAASWPNVLGDLQWGSAFPIGLSQTYCSVRNSARSYPLLKPTSPPAAALGAIIFDGCYVLASVPIAYAGQLFAEQ